MSTVDDDVDDDSAARTRIRDELGTTLFVEAGAGTGKTTALVGRIVELIATGTAPLRSIAAITFTEAAAGELRDRIREALERLADGDEAPAPGPGPATGDHARRQRAVEALAELDGAAISTLHGFAQRILAEHPFEAGLPPTFEVFDEIRSTVAFDERWGDFLDRLLDEPTARAPLQRALVCGITLAHLRTVALEFNRNWDLVADHGRTAEATVAPAPGDEAVDARAVIEALAQARQLTGWCTNDDDRLLQHVMALDGFTDRLEAAGTDLEVLQLLAQAPTLAKGNGGRAANWQDRVDDVRQSLRAAQAARDEIVHRAGRRALEQLIVHIRSLTIDAADQRRRDGTLEFHDLLVQARDLVRSRPDVARRLGQAYSHLLIDEFQDTDPIQIELAVRIVSDDPDAATKPWADLAVPPGRLFFVGDPKQAIYRFRRADIGLFLGVRDRMVDRSLSLTRNRRSVPGVIDWVNLMFAALVGEGDPGAQPSYEALTAHRGAHAPSSPVASPMPPVLRLGGPMDDQKIGPIRQIEAAEIAQAVHRVRDEAWPVGDDGHPARLADVCVLIPTRTSLPPLERAFDRAGLAYRVESSSLVYASAEVRDLLSVLRAVDDPTDTVAVVAALRSPWFGCGDDDLLEFHTAAHHWDYRHPRPDSITPDQPVAAGLESLRSLHAERWWHDASGLIEHVMADRRAFALGLDERRPRDVWRRLRFVADQARAFTDAYGRDLRRYLAWADLQCAEDARVVETILPETDDDAVRIMTVHASKGLEFPVVVLSGLNTEDRSRVNGVDVVWGDDGPEVRVFGSIATEGYADRAEREERMHRYEQLRLLYVAATRARDHLIVSLHHKATAEPRSHAARLEQAGADADHVWRRPSVDLASTDSATEADLSTSGAREAERPAAPPEAGPSGAAVLDERRRWLMARQRRMAEANIPRTVAATSVAKLPLAPAGLADATDAARPADPPPAPDPDDPTESIADGERPPWRRGRAGTAIGRAVHGVLQVVELDGGDAALADLVHNQAVAEGVADHRSEIERLVRAALGSEVVQAAVGGGRYWRELYVGAPVGERVLEGFIDLLVETPDGLTVVDYKTDAAPTTEAIDVAVDRYRLQAASYAVLVEQALGRPVDRCILLFLRPGHAVPRAILDLDRAKREVEARLTRI